MIPFSGLRNVSFILFMFDCAGTTANVRTITWQLCFWAGWVYHVFLAIGLRSFELTKADFTYCKTVGKERENGYTIGTGIGIVLVSVIAWPVENLFVSLWNLIEVRKPTTITRTVTQSSLSPKCSVTTPIIGPMQRLSEKEIQERLAYISNLIYLATEPTMVITICIYSFHIESHHLNKLIQLPCGTCTTNIQLST